MSANGKYQHLRSSVSNSRPSNNTYPIGSTFLNFADKQIGYIDALQQPQDLIPITNFSESSSYITGELVVQNNKIYKSNKATGPSTFTTADWDEYVSTDTMLKSTYDTDSSGVVDNAEKVNNHTVEKDVPSDAIFTDNKFKTNALDTTSGFLGDKLVAGTNIQLYSTGSGDIKTQINATDTTYSDSEIKTKYENNSNTNAFTDTYKTKLDGLQTQVQSDWNTTGTTAKSYIKNKPTDVTDLSSHSVTELNDISNAGSGSIITATERTKLNNLETSKFLGTYTSEANLPNGPHDEGTYAYVDTASNDVVNYLWDLNDTKWVKASPLVDVHWGGITGTLSSQTDLQAALDDKENAITYGLLNTGKAFTVNTAGNGYSWKTMNEELLLDFGSSTNDNILYTPEGWASSGKGEQIIGIGTGTDKLLIQGKKTVSIVNRTSASITSIAKGVLVYRDTTGYSNLCVRDNTTTGQIVKYNTDQPLLGIVLEDETFSSVAFGSSFNATILFGVKAEPEVYNTLKVEQDAAQDNDVVNLKYFNDHPSTSDDYKVKVSDADGSNGFLGDKIKPGDYIEFVTVNTSGEHNIKVNYTGVVPNNNMYVQFARPFNGTYIGSTELDISLAGTTVSTSSGGINVVPYTSVKSTTLKNIKYTIDGGGSGQNTTLKVMVNNTSVKTLTITNAGDEIVFSPEISLSDGDKLHFKFNSTSTGYTSNGVSIIATIGE